MTKKEIGEAKKMFDTYDLDFSGAIELVELHNGLMAMGFNVKLEQVFSCSSFTLKLIPIVVV